MTQTVEYIDIFSFSDKELIGRNETEVKTFALQLLAEGRVIYPVLATHLNKKLIVLDGVKRVLACRYIVENEVGDKFGLYKTIPTLVMEKMAPKERATLTIAANEQRSDNEIAAYLSMKALKDKNKWEDIAELYKFNPNRFKALSKLDNIIKQEFFFDAFEQGLIAMGTLFAIAKLDQTRQGMVFKKAKVLFKQKKRLTGKDIREIRSTQADAVLASLDLKISNSPAMERKEMFVYYYGKFSQAYESFGEAMAADEKGTLYRLVPVGGKQ